jgi:hypothetical protein
MGLEQAVEERAQVLVGCAGRMAETEAIGR